MPVTLVVGGSGGTPPPTGGLPPPQVSFGDLPINQVLSVANASASAGYTIDWTFVLLIRHFPTALGGGSMDPRQPRSPIDVLNGRGSPDYGITQGTGQGVRGVAWL